MKKIFFLFLLIINFWNAVGQEFQLKIIGQNERETKIIDSIGYISKHKNTKSIIDENGSFYEKLIKKGYTESEPLENFKQDDSTFNFKYKVGKRINHVRIYIGSNFQEDIASNYTIKNDTLTLPYEEIETFLKTTLKKL